ncbi:unnamed protein product [Gadus morhua 'NCC']
MDCLHGVSVSCPGAQSHLAARRATVSLGSFKVLGGCISKGSRHTAQLRGPGRTGRKYTVSLRRAGSNGQEEAFL